MFLIIVRVANDDNFEHFVVVFDYKNNKFIIDNSGKDKIISYTLKQFTKKVNRLFHYIFAIVNLKNNQNKGILSKSFKRLVLHYKLYIS